MWWFLYCDDSFKLNAIGQFQYNSEFDFIGEIISKAKHAHLLKYSILKSGQNN